MTLQHPTTRAARRAARSALAMLAILALTLGACDRDGDVRESPDTGVARIPLDTPFLAPIPATAAPSDTAHMDATRPDSVRAARGGTDSAARPAVAGARRVVRPAPPVQPRTAPQDRATAPDAVPPARQADAPAVAPETAAIEPHVVSPPPAAAPRSRVVPPRPFAVGERLTYEVRFGPLRVGTATMEVLGIETIRGTPAYHTRFEVRGGNRLYRVQDRYESWFDVYDLASLRYVQDIDEGNYERHSVFEIHPEERRYVEQGKESQPSVAQPLDEGSFIYWLRTIPLEVGKTYTFDNYFRPDRNPVTIAVLRRERVKVPAGEFDAIVVRPTIRTRGIFSEGGHAEIWFADDSTRRLLQMKSRLSFGSLNLYLR